MAGCNRASERRMDCPPTDRGIRMATGAAIHHSRSGLRLWRCLPPPASSDGHTRSTDRTTITMAEWMCREADRTVLKTLIEKGSFISQRMRMSRLPRITESMRHEEAGQCFANETAISNENKRCQSCAESSGLSGFPSDRGSLITVWLEVPVACTRLEHRAIE